MSEQKWIAEKSAIGWVVRGGEHLICRLGGLPDAEANARLIAAAPEMLEVCQLFVDGGRFEEVLARARLAITAATGTAYGVQGTVEGREGV